jgi:hypothetical protein
VSLPELGIGVDDLEFEPVPKVNGVESKKPTQAAAPCAPATLTISEAKKALAATFGVKPK